MRFLSDDPALVLNPESDVRLFAEIFNASDASKRVFSEVHYLTGDPNLTVGMGHFVGINIAELFTRLRDDAPTWAFVLEAWSKAMTPAHWQAMATETGVEGTGPTMVERAIERVLCAGNATTSCVRQRLVPWTKEVKHGFNSNRHWFTAGWQAICRAEPVARHQLLQWHSSVLEPGLLAAEERDLRTRGGIACVISAKSSGLGSRMFPVNAKLVDASNYGVHRRWSLVEVPRQAYPTANVDAKRLLGDWRSVVAWQYYTLTAGRVRSRMRAIWRTFFEATWGGLSDTLAEVTEVPRHSGTLMDERPFDFRVVFIDP